MIWGDVLGTTILACMAGGLAVPTVRNFLLGDINRDWLQDELNLNNIDKGDSSTVVGKDGSCSRVWRLRGTSYDACVETEQITLLHNRTEVIHQLGKAGLVVRYFGIKRKRGIDRAADWPNKVLAEIGAAERELFKSSYFIDWYIMATGNSIKPLVDADNIIKNMMDRYQPVLLSRVEDPDGDCELTGFLNGLVSGEYRLDLPCLSENLSSTLPGADFLPERNTGTIQTNIPASKYHKVITVSQWPETVSGRLIGELMSIQADLEVNQICEPYDGDKAKALFKRRSRAESSSLFASDDVLGDIAKIQSLLSSEKCTFFATQFQIIPRADSPKELADLVAEITKVLGDKKILYKVETIGAPACWFLRHPRRRAKRSLMPGSNFMAPREMRDQNVSALWPLPHASTGLDKSPLGPGALRYFSTPTGQSYAMNFHVVNKEKTLSHFMCFAPSRSGKSTFLSHALGGAAKFDGVRTYIFDSLEGSRFMVEAMGGIYQSFDKLALNPLDVGEDNAKNRERIFYQLQTMAGIELGKEDMGALKHAVELAFQVEPPERTLNAIFDYAFSKRSDLRSAFSQWVVDRKGNKGLRSHIFNAANDSLGGILSQSHMVGINMNEALADPVLGASVVSHIAQSIPKWAAQNGNGFIMLLEECGALLQNPGFLELAKFMFRQYGKLNGTVGMVFQDPEALIATGDAKAFLDNTATLIFFPNSKATDESLAPFNLNEEQRLFVQGRVRSTKKDDRRVLIVKRDEVSGYEESAILNVDLTPYGKSLRFYKSGADENLRMEQLQKQWGDAWTDHI
tara:strand:- start:1178 stop:3571 length:2394 start_codon:yes stop_codon:yes gene_type:complete